MDHDLRLEQGNPDDFRRGFQWLASPAALAGGHGIGDLQIPVVMQGALMWSLRSQRLLEG